MNKGTGKQIVFISSNSFSGSTWLSYVLGSHARAATLGEHNRRFEGERGSACRYCEALGRSDCEVLGGILSAPLYEAYKMPFQRFTPMGVCTLIDNSKRISWLKQLLIHGACTEINIKIIDLVRDPRGWIASCLSRNPNASPEILARHWRDQLIQRNAELVNLELPVHRVCYDLMHLDAHQTLPLISNFVGLTYSTEHYEYWHQIHHSMGGNGASIYVLPQKKGITPDREFYLSRFKQKFHDDRWRYSPNADLLTKICEGIDANRLLGPFGADLSRIDKLFKENKN